MKNDLLDFLIDDDSTPATENVSLIDDKEGMASVLLAGIQEQCTPEEYEQIVQENANLWEIYGLIPDAQMVATEATKKVVAKYTKYSYLSAATKRAAFRLARAAGDPNYTKYVKYRDLMRQFREKVLDKWNSKATREAKRILRGAAATAGSVKDARGKQMEDKIDKALKQTNAEGRNGKAIRAPKQ